eukprot:scaffold61910_cov38-Phaeocystis_antarctica.AAC.1
MVQLPCPASAGGLVQRRQRLRTATAGDLNRRHDCLARPLPEGLSSKGKVQPPRTATAGGLAQRRHNGFARPLPET